MIDTFQLIIYFVEALFVILLVGKLIRIWMPEKYLTSDSDSGVDEEFEKELTNHNYYCDEEGQIICTDDIEEEEDAMEDSKIYTSLNNKKSKGFYDKILENFGRNRR